MKHPGHSDIMNRVAPNLFGTLHRCMLQSVLILVRQLTEPATTRVRGTERANSSMRGLLKTAYGVDYKSIVPQLVAIIERAERPSAVPREWASKVVAHTDLLTGLDNEPLPPLNWSILPVCVQTIVQFVQDFEREAGLAPSAFDQSVLADQINRVQRVLAAGVSAGSTPSGIS